VKSPVLIQVMRLTRERQEQCRDVDPGCSLGAIQKMAIHFRITICGQSSGADRAQCLMHLLKQGIEAVVRDRGLVGALTVRL